MAARTPGSREAVAGTAGGAQELGNVHLD
eukprot:COSAG01_NODE_20767_length_936_cov_2.082437_2_plen_28_part_01